MNKAREWKITGSAGLLNYGRPQNIIFDDIGPILKPNEDVEVIEKSAYNKAVGALKEYNKLLMEIRSHNRLMESSLVMAQKGRAIDYLTETPALQALERNQELDFRIKKLREQTLKELGEMG